MPIHLERCDYDFDITISFRLENLQNVFEASEDPEYLYTDRFKFGPGWKLRLKWTCEEDDVYLSMKLKPGPGHMGKSIDWTVTGESSSGARYFHCSDTYTVVSSGFRWRRLLSLDDHWERYKGLRHENAVLITACYIAAWRIWIRLTSSSSPLEVAHDQDACTSHGRSWQT